MKKKYVLLLLVTAFLAGCRVNKGISYTVNGVFEDCDEPMAWLLSGGEVLDSVPMNDGEFTFSGEIQVPRLAWVCTAPNYRIAEYGCEFVLEPGALVMSKVGNAEEYVIEGSRSNDRMAALQRKSVEIVKEYASSHDMEGIEEEMERQWNALLQTGLNDNTDNMFGLYCLRELSYEVLSPNEVLDFLNRFPVEFKDDRLWSSLWKNASVQVNSMPGNKYMEFAQNDMDGNLVAAKDVIGDPANKYVLIDFWASWCGPCMRELPFLKQAYAKYHSKGFQILGVSLDRDRERWVQAMESNDMTWVNVSDLKYWDNEVAVQYGVRSIPSNFLIDCSNGVIIDKGLRGNNLEKRLSELLD